MQGLIFAALVCGLLLVAVAMMIAIDRGKKLVKMTPAEEARFEIHPTLLPEPAGITADNVQDVINDTIETGVEHPLLRARKEGNDA
jgi:hypothetical protein